MPCPDCGAPVRPDRDQLCPACGYPPQTVQEILGKVLSGKARIIDGRHEIRPGIVIHPAFRGHTYGSQLLQVHTARGELVFASATGAISKRSCSARPRVSGSGTGGW